MLISKKEQLENKARKLVDESDGLAFVWKIMFSTGVLISMLTSMTKQNKITIAALFVVGTFFLFKSGILMRKAKKWEKEKEELVEYHKEIYRLARDKENPKSKNRYQDERIRNINKSKNRQRKPLRAASSSTESISEKEGKVINFPTK